MTKCQACGATYHAIQGDGTQYFHRCPSLSAAELDAAVKAGKVTLPKGETADEAVIARTYERNNARDENLVSTRASDKSRAKADGAGVVTIADPATPPIVVVP